MDCVETATTMGTRKAALGGEMLFFASPAGRYQHQLLYLQSPRSSALLQTEETAAGPPERAGGGAPWEDFSVDDLLDLGAGKEQNAGEDEFLPPDDAEDEEEEDRKESSSGGGESCSPSVLSFQAIPPSSDPIVPAGDVADLEWLSRFVDDSYSEYPSAVAAPPPLHNHPRYHSPVPATLQLEAKLEAPKPPGSATGVSFKRTWGSCCFSTDSLAVPAKARRSKRSRTVGRVWSPLRLPPLLPKSSSSSCSSGYSYASCSASSSISSLLDFAGGKFSSVDARLVRQERKKKGRKPKAKSMAVAAEPSGGGEQPARRRCSHCGVDKTPQWRAGPMGAKTLCNACGVRYKSGRLLPEYRPAGSPTFLGHIHSNSHRRVLEMRRKKELVAAGTPPPPPPLAAASPPYGVV